MNDRELHESVITHLQQAHAMERSQVPELRTLATETTVPAIAALLRAHVEQTTGHGDEIEARLDELGAGGSIRLLSQAFVAAMPKLVIDRVRTNDACAVLRDAVSAEALEIAAYTLLEAEALRAGDESTAVLAREILEAEAAMRDELMTFWNQAVNDKVETFARRADGASRTRIARELLVDHLQDVHALERNATIMLTTVLGSVEDELVRARVRDHCDATQRHADALVQRLRELNSRPSLRKQAQGYAFAAVKGPINLLRSERAAKDLRDMYVVEHLELVAYAQLAVLAERCGDDVTLQLARAHAEEERAMADWLERDAARFLLESLSKA